jgi:hypothetical protein
MSASGESSDFPPGDDYAWDLGTYREFLEDLDHDTRLWCLPWVQICLFSPRQPLGFEMFAGKLAALGIDRLGLDSTTTLSLLEAVGGEGVRIPGTSYILRVVRPWHALFEENPTPKLSLPENWLEGVELWKNQTRIWIGKRVLENPLCPAPTDGATCLQVKARKEFGNLNWSLYVESPSGWKLL